MPNQIETSRPRKLAAAAAALVGCVYLSGCGASLPLGGLSTGALELPTIALPTPEGIRPPKGTALEVYTRIARGVLTCWFGAHGPLKGGYIYHAEAQPERMGGRAIISIHEREKPKSNKRGSKAFEVTISPSGTSASVDVRNVKLKEPLSASFNQDAHRWAAGDEGCVKGGIKEGWGAEVGASKKKTKKKKK